MVTSTHDDVEMRIANRGLHDLDVERRVNLDRHYIVSTDRRIVGAPVGKMG